MRTCSVRATLAAAVLVSASWLAGCSAGGGGAAAQGGTNTSGSSGASSGGTSSGGSSGGITKCVGTGSKAQQQPLDIYIMLDRSLSMEESTGTVTKWGAVSSALSSFVGQPMDSTSVGLQYFPQEDPRSWDGNSCRAASYAAPEVEIGPLAQTGPRIRSSMTAQQLQSGTPTSPALQGAIDHARTWAARAESAGHAVVVILATDGEPTTCTPSISDVRSIAASGVSGTPSIRTFVIGIGDNLTNLNGIAASGGTTAAFLVAGGDVGPAFLQALNEIRGKTVGCSYQIPAPPAGQIVEHDKVNVQYLPGNGGAPIKFAQAASAAACGASTGAWYYDRTPDPTGIVLCPSTCSTVQADGAASVEIVLGCTTREKDPSSSGGTSSGGTSSGGEW